MSSSLARAAFAVSPSHGSLISSRFDHLLASISWLGPLKTLADELFGGTTVIPFYLNEEGHVRIVVYNPRGRHMATLLDDLRAFGEHQVVWDGRDELGDQLPSGIYFYRLETGTFAEVRKMTLLK